jgi:SAM-dependent methyltransferase
MQFDASGIWPLETARKRHRHAAQIAELLANVLPPEEPVLDLGCGLGFYLSALARRGYRCRGVEGTPGIAGVALFPDIVQADLSQPLKLDWPKSSILCLEVAEHLFPAQEPQLVATIDEFCSGWLVISWAVPGQPGHGHHNCRPNSYVYRRFRELGFELQPEPTFLLREAADEATHYFRNTLLVFQRGTTPERNTTEIFEERP